MQQFRTVYSVQYPVVRKSATDGHHAFCTVCSVDINISHSSIGDIKKHVLTLKHVAGETSGGETSVNIGW